MEPNSTAIVNMASRLGVIKFSLSKLTNTVAVWSPVAGYGVDSPSCIVAASLPVVGSQLSAPPPEAKKPQLWALWFLLLVPAALVALAVGYRRTGQGKPAALAPDGVAAVGGAAQKGVAPVMV